MEIAAFITTILGLVPLVEKAYGEVSVLIGLLVKVFNSKEAPTADDISQLNAIEAAVNADIAKRVGEADAVLGA